MRYLVSLAFVSFALVGCNREARWVRADVREASAAYEAAEADHLETNYSVAYRASGRDMTCDDNAFPAFDFECIPFPHN